MEKQIKMPKLRPEMESGVVCAWLKEEGQQVLAGEPLYEIETDKVVSQIGLLFLLRPVKLLKKQLCEEGDRIPVDGPVAVLETG